MRKTILSAVILLAGASAWAQNLNPTVEVTNIYAREATGIEKPSQLLEMPDSVLRFNLDMDYSVNPTPYQGSYEFKPYLVQLRPQARPSGENTLFVRVGAGYSLHPEATVVWTPVKKDHLRLNVYADHNSYFGKYHDIVSKGTEFLPGGEAVSGARSRTTAGVDGLFTWAGGGLAADLQYRNMSARWIDTSNHNNILQLKARVKSAPGAPMDYEGGTRMAYIALGGGDSEFHTVWDGFVGTHFGVHKVKLNLFAETVNQNMRGILGDVGFVGNMGLGPHYLLNTGNFHMDLGVKFSFLFRSDENFCPHPGGIFFPDVRISYDLVQDVAVLYASATGGDNIISYDRLLSANPFMMFNYDWYTDNMITRVNACIGARGNVSERFHYDVRAGYRWDENAWTWGVVENTLEDYHGSADSFYSPCMGYASPLHTFYVNLDAGYKNEKLDIGANVYYGYTPIPDLQGQLLFAPAPFKASVRAFYNWGGRIQAGATAEIRSKLPGPRTIPGYVDLGVQAQFQMTRNLGFWIKGGNLLNQAIQRVPLYAEKGLYFTVGATFCL